MAGITPTFGIIETGRNVRAYTKANMPALWDQVKVIAPFIIGLLFFDALVNSFVPAVKEKFGLGGLLASYFYTCFVISWHRIVMQGADAAQTVNPLKPEKSDWAFIGMGIGLAVALIVVLILSSFLAILGPIGAVLLILVIVAVAVAFIKFCLYFPAKALRGHMSLKDSFHATKGYLWKIFAAPVVASWRVYLATFGYVLLMIGILMGVGYMSGAMGAGEPSTPVVMLTGFVLSLPIMLIFYPIMYALGVGVLSNYYLYITQNKSA
jgi:hypothetical protein